MPSGQSSAESKPRIAITMGDPVGVGPEITLKSVRRQDVLSLCRPVIIGDKRVLTKAAQCLGVVKEELLELPNEATLVDLDNVPATDHNWGQVSAEAGRAAADYIERAVQEAVDGNVSAIVTAPINKDALNRAGVPHPGHTEMLAALTNTSSYAMMLVGPSLRVIHVSTHISLKEAIKRVTRDRVLAVIQLAVSMLQKEGVMQPRVAVAGLNPHAGEGGLFGKRDAQEIRPAVEAARIEGIDASGPHPPDTVFWHAQQGRYDIVVVMYHDQGHIPIKLTGFDSSINVTAGLPIIRTSVDHGTAFDIAGTGTASETSMVAAISYAVRLAQKTGHEASVIKPS